MFKAFRGFRGADVPQMSGEGATVRAAVARSLGEPEIVAVEEIEPPELRAGTARVQVHAAAVNFPDLLVLAGKYQASVPPPYTPGCEFSGRVVETAPGVTRVQPGDLVFGLATHGAFAEQVVLDDWRLTPVPDSVDPTALAAFSVTYLTAYHALRTYAKVQPGEYVTVLGAAGGVGLAAVDIARALGALPIAAGSDLAKLQVCRDKGAVALVDYTREDLKARINEISGGGADVVVDPVGGTVSEPALRAMRWGGRYVVVGFASGDIPRIPLNLVLLKGLWITAIDNRTILQHLPEVAPLHRAEVVGLLLSGAVAPHISSVHPLDEVVAALREVADRKAVGKVLVQVGKEA